MNLTDGGNQNNKNNKNNNLNPEQENLADTGNFLMPLKSRQNKNISQNRPATNRPSPQNPAETVRRYNKDKRRGESQSRLQAQSQSQPGHTSHTRTFDTNPNIKNAGRRPSSRAATPEVRNMNPDGTYNFTGRDIKSNRQRLSDINSKNGRTDGEPGELTISHNKNKSKNRDEDIELKRGGFILSGILKVALYISGVILISGFLSYNIIAIANDVFAFVKDDKSVNVVIPENAEISEISRILFDNELIKYPRIFDFYINYRKKDRIWEFEPGIYSVSAALNYDEMIWEFRVKPGEREIVRVTIPEHFNTDQIIDIFVEENGIGTREGFVRAINDTDYSQFGYRFLEPLYAPGANLSPDRKYMLEGYLFPDTYEFYKDENEINIITKFLNNFGIKFAEEFYAKSEILDRGYVESSSDGRGLSIDDIIILASIIEREGRYRDDLPKISAVFHNRLLNANTFPYLQSDATIMYSYGFAKQDLTQADLEEDLPYNTYTRRGLPPSAICNPGYESIHAALWPEEEFLYYYFITDLTGRAFYSQTASQHEAHRARIRAERAAAANAG
ncbi:MAG: endolytic transglycosylase MltG [Oscillospiraceae bacterium]|nr:endolytic transglycosylase MltG [Oscillospiraceae bacterium]